MKYAIPNCRHSPIKKMQKSAWEFPWATFSLMVGEIPGRPRGLLADLTAGVTAGENDAHIGAIPMLLNQPPMISLVRVPLRSSSRRFSEEARSQSNVSTYGAPALIICRATPKEPENKSRAPG